MRGHNLRTKYAELIQQARGDSFRTPWPGVGNERYNQSQSFRADAGRKHFLAFLHVRCVHHDFLQWAWGWCQDQLTSLNWWACSNTGSCLKSGYDFGCLSVIGSSHPGYTQHDLGSKVRTIGYDWKNKNYTTGIRNSTHAISLNPSINLEMLIWKWYYSETQHQI